MPWLQCSTIKEAELPHACTGDATHGQYGMGPIVCAAYVEEHNKRFPDVADTWGFIGHLETDPAGPGRTFRECVELVLAEHEATLEHGENSDAARGARQMMDGPWDALSKDERELITQLTNAISWARR